MRSTEDRRPRVAVLLAVCLLTALLGGSFICSPSLTERSAIALGNSQSAEAVPGEILVKFREPIVAAAQLQVHQALGFQELGQVEGLGVVRVGLEPGITPEEAVRLYEARPEVEYAEPNYILRTDGIPNDPLYRRPSAMVLRPDPGAHRMGHRDRRTFRRRRCS